MFKAYIIAKWIFFIFIMAPVMIIIISAYTYPIGITRDILTGIVYLITIVWLFNEKYNIDIQKLNKSVKFENSVGLIYFAHLLVIVLLLVLSYYPVLVFLSLPVILFIVLCYALGFSKANSEILKYKKLTERE
jgi:hypothetical protein